MKLQTRIINGKESDTHFLYIDGKGREWSVVNFKSFMSKLPFGEFLKENNRIYEDLFDYIWEAMYFPREGEKEILQVRGLTPVAILEQINLL